MDITIFRLCFYYFLAGRDLFSFIKLFWVDLLTDKYIASGISSLKSSSSLLVYLDPYYFLIIYQYSVIFMFIKCSFINIFIKENKVESHFIIKFTAIFITHISESYGSDSFIFYWSRTPEILACTIYKGIS